MKVSWMEEKHRLNTGVAAYCFLAAKRQDRARARESASSTQPRKDWSK